MKISVVLITKKLDPKIEWALDCLKNQTFKDFEYIIVDGYYNKRKDEVKKLIIDKGVKFPVLHIPDKPSRWRGQRFALSNARNTALIFATGQYIVHHDDCCKMPPNWLEGHLGWLEKGYLATGSWIGYQFLQDGKGIEGVYGLEYRSKIIKEPKEISAGWFFGANCSYPLEAALDINGFDEEFDGELGQEDINFGIRLERKGFKTIFDPALQVEIFMMTHRYEKMIPPVNKMLNDGKLHFSNEWITQRFLSDVTRTMPYGNVIDIRGTRKMMKEGGYSIEKMYEMMKGWINPDKYDWRDGVLIEDKLNKEEKFNVE